jgi:hypothetical protein
MFQNMTADLRAPKENCMAQGCLVLRSPAVFTRKRLRAEA